MLQFSTGARGRVGTKRRSLLLLVLPLLSATILFPCAIWAQATGILRGKVADPTGALVPGASLSLTASTTTLQAASGADGAYVFARVPAGSYTLSVSSPGFATFSQAAVTVEAGHTRDLNVTLTIAVAQQNVTVNSQASGVSLEADENAGAVVIKGSDLDALSDDPDELQNELQALAGPAAGPNGGQIYIDGFSGGQIPPKSSIREIRVNQNPFSAEFDRIGYGRIEILTKPGSNKFSGHVTSLATDSAWDTKNPLIAQQPSYYFDFLQSDVTGPIAKNASYFFTIFRMSRQTQAIVDAVNPSTTSQSIAEAVPNPSTFMVANPRIDLQLGANNTLSIRDSFFLSTATGNGVGLLNLPEQGYNMNNKENDIQASDTVVVNTHLLNETHFQWRRVRDSQAPSLPTPTITVQGSFVNGGSSAGTVQDHQDDLELQNYSTWVIGPHNIRFGARLRSYRDANYANSGANGNYIFTTVGQYNAGTPSQYQATVLQNPLARALVFDGALFYQDEWHFRPYLALSDGLRFETQNRIHDHADWGPRLALSWAPWHQGTKPPKTVVRAGYGWFYDRFTVPNSFNGSSTPYVIQAIHENGINQQNYVVNNLPASDYNPNQAVPASTLASLGSASVPTVYSIDPHFHAALDMQGGVGVDQQIGKTTFNVTYLFTRGVHQYLTNNINGQDFDPSTYTLSGPLPSVYSYQFQSEGVYNEQQVMVTANAQLHHLVLHGNYTFTRANSDTQSVNYFPSDWQDPGLDYGRATFGISHRLFLLGTYNLPHSIILAPLLVAQSGTPYNITLGSDLTGNNQFNARPTYGTCGATNVVSTPFGCLDTDPSGKDEPIIPYNLGTGPANFVMHMRVSKAIGIGPRIKGSTGPQAMQGGGGGVGGRGLSGGQAQVKLDASVPRRYNLTLVAGFMNMFNIVNLGAPNGTMSSPLFGKSISLANGPFGSPTPANRTIFAQATFTF